MLNIFWKRFLVFFIAFVCFSKVAFSNINDDSNNTLGVNSLMSAVIDRDIDGVKFFVNTDKQSINQKNIGGATPLHLATRINNFEIAKILVENGADVNVFDNENMTPLMRASISGSDEIIKLLLQHKANASLLSSVKKSVIYYSTYSSCSNCLNNLFDAYDFKENMKKSVLNEQLTNSYQVARNREDSVIQKILENYLNKGTVGKKYRFSFDGEPKVIEEENIEENNFNYVIDLNKNGEVTEFKKVPEISIEKSNLPNLSDSKKEAKSVKIRYYLKDGEHSKEINNKNYLSEKKSSENILEKQQNLEKEKNNKNKLILFKIKKVEEDKKSKTEKEIKKLKEEKEKVYKFIKGQAKSNPNLEKKDSIKDEVSATDVISIQKESSPQLEIAYQPITDGNDEFLKSFKKIFLFKTEMEDKKKTKDEISLEEIKNQNKIESNKNFIFKQKISMLEKNESLSSESNQNLSENQHFYYDNNREIELSENQNLKRYFFIPN